MTPTLKEQLEQWIEREAERYHESQIDNAELNFRHTDSLDIAFKQGCELLMPMLIVAVEVLNDVLCEGHSDLCKNMKPIRPNYSCQYEHAEEALNKITEMITQKNITTQNDCVATQGASDEKKHDEREWE